MIYYVISLILGFLGAWFISRWGKDLGLLDKPSYRSSHKGVVPKGGGIGILAAFIFTSLYLENHFTFWLTATFIALTSLYVDRFYLDPIPRLAIHFITAIIFLVGTIYGDLALINVIFIISMSIFIVGTANFYNFMDGIDGIAGVTGIVGFGLFAYYISIIEGDTALFKLSLSLLFACLGFLPFNFPRAKVFIGDVGSIMLGFIFAAMVILLSKSLLDFICLAGFLFPFYADELITMAIRIKDRENLFKPHRRHLYQVLANEMGIHHWKVSVGYGILQLFVGLSILLLKSQGILLIILLLIIFLSGFIYANYIVRKRMIIDCRDTWQGDRTNAVRLGIEQGGYHMDKTNYKRIFLSPPHMNEEELQLIHKAFESNYIAPTGPMVDAFEREFAEKVGVSYALAVSSGTAAMHLALRCLGVGPGDEVFASTLTFIGSISPAVFQGATPVLIDSDRSTWNMDPDLLAEELEACHKKGRLPKAVIPTDLYGQCADYGRIFPICEKYNVPVIIDAAEAMGSKFITQSSMLPTQCEYRHAGVGANAAVYSFNGNKIITTSGGGMLASDDKDLIDYARKLSQQAKEDFVHYEHEEIGYNYRMSNILAAIGRGQLKVLDERVKIRREIYKYYKQALGDIPGIDLMPEAEYAKSNHWLTLILITPEEFGADRETIRLALESENIEARPVWKPMHMQPVFNIWQKDKGERIKDSKTSKRYYARVVGGEVAEDLFNRGLCLPSGTAMTEEDLDRVIDVIYACRK